MTTTDKTKPQADDKGLSNLLGTSKQITAEIIADDETIASLIAQVKAISCYSLLNLFIYLVRESILLARWL